MAAFERRSYSLVQHRLSLQAPPNEPVICDYWRKHPVENHRRRQSDWVSGTGSTNQNARNWVAEPSTNQSGRNWVTTESANQSSRNCVKLPNNKVKVKVANEVHTVTLRRKKAPKEETVEPREKKSPIQDILKRFSWHSRKKKAEKDGGRRRPHSFVNSQEWTISRAVPDLKLGILGTVNSGKSALVHRYLTGSYMQEESPEGGRFKKEVVIDGQSYLLLIRDEGSAPEMQFSLWVDAVIFVFSLENENSFNTIYSYYAKMAHYRNTAEVPIILVGTQDAISESNPRVIDDTRARKLANDLRRCAYYETCATYGLNVERVFQDACQKIIHLKSRDAHGGGVTGATPTNSRPTTPAAVATPPPRFYSNQGFPMGQQQQQSTPGDSSSGGGTLPSTPQQTASSSSSSSAKHHQHFQGHSPTTLPAKEHRHDKKHKDRHKHKSDHDQQQQQQSQQHPFHNKAIAVAPPTVPSVPPPSGPPPPGPSLVADPHAAEMIVDKLQQHQLKQQQQQHHPSYHEPITTPGSTPIPQRKNKKNAAASSSHSIQKSNSFSGPGLGQRNSQNGESITLATPTSTPVLSRKNKNNKSFIGKNKVEEGNEKGKNEQLGSGRTIPIKQGHLYKKSNKPLSKDWKKKYVTLGANGKMTYFPSLNDYMDDVHGKEINLQRTTVKIPGALRPRGSGGNQNIQTNPNHQNGKAGVGNKENAAGAVLTAFTPLGGNGETGDGGAVVIPNSSVTPEAADHAHAGIFNGDMFPAKQTETPNVKKRHRRAKSGTKNLDPGQEGDSDGYEFMIVSLDNKQWQFEAGSVEERDEWVASIEQSILSSLQSMESNKSKSRSNTMTDPQTGSVIRQVKGNERCADCEATEPDWASLNIGALICIECSGIHRNLGTHLSRVRSLDLDEWPPELVAVMSCIGNTLSNSVWEANPKGMSKPTPNSSRDDKERWIRAKYEAKEFMPPPPYLDVPLPQQLIDAIARQDVHNTILVLGYCKPEHVNAPYSKTDKRTALHIAAALGNVVLVQLLLWYGANVKVVDHENRNALWYARSANSEECVALLIAQGCPEHPTLPRRPTARQPPLPPQQQQRGAGEEAFDKLPASVI